MTTHNENERSSISGARRVTRPVVGVSKTTWGAAAIGAALSLAACGARVNGGNTGSETHWLQACDADSDCGSYACLCGICSRACENDGQCDEGDNPDGKCAASETIGSDGKCGGDVPAQICVSQDHSDTSEPPTDPEICDGSDDIRLLTQSYGGGEVPSTYGFFGAYGWSFLAIDGECNFWLSNQPGQVLVGEVTDRSVLDSYEASYYQKLGRFAGYHPSGGCPDAGASYVADPSGAVQFVCDAQEPPEYWEETRDAASDLAAALTLVGERSRGSLRAVLLQATSESSNVAPWPLDSDPTDWVIEESLSWDIFARPDFGIGFNAGERAEALRTATAGETNWYGKTFSYAGAAGTQQLSLLVRDDIPPKVFAALEATQKSFYGQETLGETCDVSTGCDNGLTCMARSESAGGGNACNTCITPDDNGAEWACQSNADCCGGLTCCVDCGDKSGTCIAEPDPCETCVESGANWQPGDKACLPACIPDSVCWSECRGACSLDNCEACGRSDDCWAAGCEIRELGAFQVDCVAPTESEDPPNTSCEVDATDVSLAGVNVHLEADRCQFESGQGGQFRYTVTFEQALDFTTEASAGCSMCGAPSEAETWVNFRIADGAVAYCPECDVGCCAPAPAAQVSLDAQSVEGTVDWPGLQWSGPSDTSNEPSGAFPPGSYAATVTVELPGLGQIVATLPIEVTEP